MINTIFKKPKSILLLSVIGVVGVSLWYTYETIGFNNGIVKLDQEDLKDGSPLNPSTQSINRYNSKLRDFDKVEVDIKEDNHTFALTLTKKDDARKIFVEGVNLNYLVPLLPYEHKDKPDDFDLANLMLAEYARNGISLSHQKSNTKFGVFNSTEGMFNNNAEYIYEGGKILPNSSLKPKRLSITNNCLKPGLWEVAATDSVGEMYHGWFNFPKKSYFNMVRLANNIKISDWGLSRALKYRDDLSNVNVDLDRLRKEGEIFTDTKAIYNADKRIGSYSTQDSRRKSQQGYYKVSRNGKDEKFGMFSELQSGDQFRMHKFISPGIYSATDHQIVTHDPSWDHMVIKEVSPLTKYPGGKNALDPFGYIEVSLLKNNNSEAIVVGNIPVSLLVFQDDYRVPAFGAGVLSASEIMERRFLRVSEGPVPHYAYQVRKNEGSDKWGLVNNHVTGYEQIYLRPFEEDGKLYLRMTVVSYERIVDLLEVEVEVDGVLAQRIHQASSQYQPPMFRVYRDANII